MTTRIRTLSEYPALMPLQNSLFLWAWAASMLSFSAALMADISSIWMLTSLTDNTTIIAVAQSSVYASLIVLAIPSGVIASIFDRRLVLLSTHVTVIVALISLFIAYSFDKTSIFILLAHIFVLAGGAAISAALWQVSTPDLAAQSDLEPAVTLVLTGYNVSRLIGPAAGGAILLLSGPAAALGTCIALYGTAALLLGFSRWPHTAHGTTGFVAAFALAVRTIRASTAVRQVSGCGFAFAFCASSVWALLPVYARDHLGDSPSNFGLLTASLGVGAIVATATLPRLRQSLNANRLLMLCSWGIAGGTALLAMVHHLFVACILGIWIGHSWLIGITILGTCSREIVPLAERAQSVVIYLLAFSLGMTIGSMAWGQLAAVGGHSTSLLVSSALFLLMSPILLRLLPVHPYPHTAAL